MDAQALIKVLNETTGQSFRTPAGPIVRGIIKTLDELLAPGELVTFGFEESALEFTERGWEGELRWILVTEARVLQVKVTVETRDKRGALVVKTDVLPLPTLQKVSIESSYYGNTPEGEVHLRTTKIEAKFAEGRIELSAELPSKRAESLLRLARLLRSPGRAE